MYISRRGPSADSISVINCGAVQGLDLVEPLFLGGLPGYYGVSPELGFTRGFVGCISRLGLGPRSRDISRTREKAVGITGCETCAQNPCTNGGVCQESNSPTGYVCLCPQVRVQLLTFRKMSACHSLAIFVTLYFTLWCFARL